MNDVSPIGRSDYDYREIFRIPEFDFRCLVPSTEKYWNGMLQGVQKLGKEMRNALELGANLSGGMDFARFLPT